MKRLVRIVLTLIAAVVLIGLIAIVGVMVFVNPNDLKPQINQAVKTVTGRDLQIKQNISWSIFPWLGLQINEAKLSNLPGFGKDPFAQVKKLAIQVRLLPLLHKQLEIGRLQAQGLRLHLIRNSRGQVNWQLNTKSSTNTPLSIADNPPNTVQKWKPLGLVIAGIDIRGGHFLFEDQLKHQRYELSNLSLKSANLAANKNTFFALQFDLKKNNDSLPTKVKLNSQLKLAADGKTIDLNPLRLDINLPNSTKNTHPPIAPPISIETTASLNLEQARLEAPEIYLTMGQNQLTGHFEGENLIKHPSWSGEFHSQQIRWNQFTVQNIQLPFSFANNTLHLRSIQGDLYQGHYQGDLTLYVDKPSQRFISHHQLTALNLGLLFQALSDHDRSIYVSGLANTSLTLASQGTSTQALLQNLQGQGQFDLQNGAIRGINFSYWIAVGKSLLQQKPSPPAQGNDTPFDEFGGHFIIQQGLLRNNDLLIRSGRLHILGKGVINLAQQQVDYRLRAQPVQSDGSPDGLAIPLKITGSFNQLHIAPTLDESSFDFIKEKIKNKLQEHLQEWDLKKLFQ